MTTLTPIAELQRERDERARDLANTHFDYEPGTPEHELAAIERYAAWRLADLYCERAEKRPARIAPAASEGIGPTHGTSEESTRQNGHTAAAQSD